MNAFVGQTFQMNQLINLKQVVELIGVCRSTIYEMMNPKSKYYDSTFPKPVRLTEIRVGWVSQEIYDWLELKIAQRKE